MGTACLAASEGAACQAGGSGATEKASGRHPARGGVCSLPHDGCTLRNSTALGSSTQTFPISLCNDSTDVTTNYWKKLLLPQATLYLNKLVLGSQWMASEAESLLGIDAKATQAGIRELGPPLQQEQAPKEQQHPWPLTTSLSHQRRGFPPEEPSDSHFPVLLGWHCDTARKLPPSPQCVCSWN